MDVEKNFASTCQFSSSHGCKLQNRRKNGSAAPPAR
jgi:hypothetical protein